MPHTVNGIGTAYYGRKGLRKHRGVCEGCGRQGVLENYETGLYFTVLFIPLIPLGRKQILDYCPACTRHRAISAGEWQSLSERSIAERMAAASRNPDDPAAAMEMHGCLDFFGRAEEAARMAGLLESRFSGRADVQLYLGGWHEREGRDREADACFGRALAAAPEDPTAARAVGIGCVQRGDLKRARELLGRFLEPGPEQDPGVVCLLAAAVAEGGGKEEALALYEKARQGAPELARQKEFRKAVREAERGAGAGGGGGGGAGLVPPAARGLFRRWGLVAAAAVLAGGVLYANRWLAARQELWVVNGIDAPAEISVDGGPAEKVPPRKWRRLPVGEGRHSAVVRRAGQADERIDFTVSNGWFERFKRDSVFVLNPGGAAVVVRETTVYAAVPVTADGPADEFSIESFVPVRGVNYAFEEFPQTLRVESGTSRVRKTRAWALMGDPAALLGTLAAAQVGPEGLLGFMERHLQYGGSDDALLRVYARVGAALGHPGRCVDFLAGGLARRPVNVEWHRMYQTACRAAGREEGLAERYDAMLAAEPGSSALLYLCGRLEARGRRAMDYFRRSMEADPQNAYPRFAASYQGASRGDLAGARALGAEACRLRPGDADMSAQLFAVRLALGEFADLAVESRRALGKEPFDGAEHGRLLAVLSAAGDSAGAEAAHRAYVGAFLQRLGLKVPAALLAGAPAAYAGGIADRNARAAVAGAALKSLLELLYHRGDFERMLEEGAALQDEGARQINAFRASLELGRPADAEKCLSGEPDADAAYPFLLLSLAWKRAGDQPKAEEWRARAVKLLGSGDPESRVLAEMLGQGERLDVRAAIEDLSLAMNAKAIALLALADVCPAGSGELLAAARRVNVPSGFPHHFLQRAAAQRDGG